MYNNMDYSVCYRALPKAQGTLEPLSIPYQPGPSTPQKNEIFIKKKGGGNYCLWFLHAHEADVELYYVFFFAIKKKEGKFEESFNRKTKAVKQLCINS